VDLILFRPFFPPKKLLNLFDSIECSSPLSHTRKHFFPPLPLAPDPPPHPPCAIKARAAPRTGWPPVFPFPIPTLFSPRTIRTSIRNFFFFFHKQRMADGPPTKFDFFSLPPPTYGSALESLREKGFSRFSARLESLPPSLPPV